MDIKKYELKKILSSKAMWILVIMFCLYNILNIYSYRYMNEEIKVFNEIVDTVGYKVNDSMKEKFKVYYEENSNNALELINSKGIGKYEILDDFCKDMRSFDINKLFNEEEKQIIQKASIIGGYYEGIDLFGEKYKGYKAEGWAEADIKILNLSGKAIDTAKKNEKIASERIKEIKDNGEQKSLFVTGMHRIMFEEILKPIAYQIILLIVLMAAFIFNYEFENKTHLIAYTSKRGRNLTKDKLFAAGTTTLIITTILLVLGAITCIITFDFSRIWGMSIGSYFNWETNMPNVPWFEITFGQYLLLIIVVIYISMLIFTGITFVISNFIRNTYIDFTIFLLIAGGGLMMVNLPLGSSNLIYATAYTPFTFIYGLSNRFLISAGLTGGNIYEVVTLSVWTILCVVLGYILIKRFKRQDIAN